MADGSIVVRYGMLSGLFFGHLIHVSSSKSTVRCICTVLFATHDLDKISN